MPALRLNGVLITLNGVVVTLNGPDPNPYGSGRLAFATPTPRRGVILTDGARQGTILNPRRAPEPVELTS